MTARAQRTLLLLIVAGVALVMAAPLAWLLLGSLRTDTEILSAPFALPERWRWDQWSQAWTEGELGRASLNSLLVTGMTVVATVILGAAAAYPLSRTSVVRQATGPVFALYLLGLIVPAQAAVVPTFLLLRTLRLLDTPWALILPNTAWSLPLAVVVFAGFFRGQSREPEEAARLDGCGPLQLFWRIAFPLARPAVGVVSVVTGLAVWNEFLFALLFVHGPENRTLPLALLAFSSAHTVDYGLTFAALSMMSLPLLIAYAFVQRTLIEGSAGVFA